MKSSGLSAMVWLVGLFTLINLIWLLASSSGGSFGAALRTHAAGLVVSVIGCATLIGLIAADAGRTVNLAATGVLFVAYVGAFVLDIRRTRGTTR
ncbi:hypothetical protein AB0M43_26250 [Longispora sp. NPDC051575]|uniref:hypothetical protein n=1 Tax=Longispora sp. NPDC051575 TaxID=3154943 RepID=UPI00341834B8